ncbi:MAG: methylenetetrahydrofolate reductase [Dehalococcoidia bacterium]
MNEATTLKAPPAGEQDAVAEPANLSEKIAAGRFIVSVEVDPPRGISSRRVVDGVRLLRDAGVDVVNVADSPMARARVSPIAIGVLLKQELGVEAIVHFTTRDRNLMAIHSDLLGAHVLGIRNVLCLRGDPPQVGGYADAIGVWDVNSSGLMRILKLLNEGKDWAEKDIGKPTQFLIGASVSPTAPSFERELKLLKRKREAGASFFMTQAIFNPEALYQFFERVKGLKLPFIVGIMPLQNYRHAEFLHRELPGIDIPEDIRERMKKAGEDGRHEGDAIAKELYAVARELAAGVYFIPSFNRYEPVAELVASLS